MVFGNEWAEKDFREPPAGPDPAWGLEPFEHPAGKGEDMTRNLKNRWKAARFLGAGLILALCLSGTQALRAAGDDAAATPTAAAPATLSQAEQDAIAKAVAEKLAATQGSSPIKVNANLQFCYTHVSNGVVGANGTYSSSKNQWDAYSFKRVELFLSSTVAGDPQVLWGMSFDFAQPSFNGLGDPTGTLLGYGGVTSVSGLGVTLKSVPINPFTLVKDMWGKVVLDPGAVLFAGQNKFPQGLEGRTPTYDLDFINYSNLTTYFGNKRDIGLQVMGAQIPAGPVSLEYSLDLIQGAGQSTADNNVDKDLAGRVGVTYDEFFLGASGYDGWEPNGARWDWGLEGKWTSGPLRIQGEYIMGQVNPADSAAQNNSVWSPLATSINRQVNPQGYYLSANYRWKDLRLGARFDGYNADQAAGSVFDSELDTLTLGADLFLNKDKCKLTLNWEDHYAAGVEAFNLWTAQAQFHI